MIFQYTLKTLFKQEFFEKTVQKKFEFFCKLFDQKNAVFWRARSPSKLVLNDAEGAGRRILDKPKKMDVIKFYQRGIFLLVRG